MAEFGKEEQRDRTHVFSFVPCPGDQATETGYYNICDKTKGNEIVEIISVTKVRVIKR